MVVDIRIPENEEEPSISSAQEVHSTRSFSFLLEFLLRRDSHDPQELLPFCQADSKLPLARDQQGRNMLHLCCFHMRPAVCLSVFLNHCDPVSVNQALTTTCQEGDTPLQLLLHAHAALAFHNRRETSKHSIDIYFQKIRGRNFPEMQILRMQISACPIWTSIKLLVQALYTHLNNYHPDTCEHSKNPNNQAPSLLRMIMTVWKHYGESVVPPEIVEYALLVKNPPQHQSAIQELEGGNSPLHIACESLQPSWIDICLFKHPRSSEVANARGMLPFEVLDRSLFLMEGASMEQHDKCNDKDAPKSLQSSIRRLLWAYPPAILSLRLPIGLYPRILSSLFLRKNDDASRGVIYQLLQVSPDLVRNNAEI